MKKYKFGLLALLFVLGLFVFNTNSVEALVPGCSSTTNYSATTGASCAISTAAPTPEPETLSVCSNGVNTVTGFVCGCTSRNGWSSINGRSCTGCDSTSGYNLLTGASCVPTPLPPVYECKNGYDLKTGFICGCTSIKGYSATTGEYCGKTTTPPDYQSPVISGVSGPQYLDVNGTGTWTIKAYDKNGGFLSYSVVWGDGTPSNAFEVATYKTELSIAHAYATSGTYKPKFTVTNNLGQSASASSNVRVGSSETPPIYECKNGYDVNTGFRCGCTSVIGYSSYDGNSCALKTLPSGCTSIYGYSSTTGELCNGKITPIPMPNPTPIATCTITSTLRLGSTGADVSCLQSRIGLISDGKFGPRTLIAVKAFQANAGLRADGVVGPKSISALEVAN